MQNGRQFADDILRCFFWNSLKFVPKGPINNIPELVQILAWCRLGDKPLSEPIMVSLLTHICVTRPQWVNLSDHHGAYRCPGNLLWYVVSMRHISIYRDHCVYAPSKLETALQCKAVSHWLGAYTFIQLLLPSALQEMGREITSCIQEKYNQAIIARVP